MSKFKLGHIRSKKYRSGNTGSHGFGTYVTLHIKVLLRLISDFTCLFDAQADGQELKKKDVQLYLMP